MQLAKLNIRHILLLMKIYMVLFQILYRGPLKYQEKVKHPSGSLPCQSQNMALPFIRELSEVLSVSNKDGNLHYYHLHVYARRHSMLNLH